MTVSATRVFEFSVTSQDTAFGILARLTGVEQDALREKSLSELMRLAADGERGGEILVTSLERGQEAPSREISVHMTRAMLSHLRIPESRTEMLVNYGGRPVPSR